MSSSLEIPKHLLTGNEVAAILNVSKSYAFKLMRDRYIPVIKIGRSVRVHPDALREFIKVTTTPGILPLADLAAIFGAANDDE